MIKRIGVCLLAVCVFMCFSAMAFAGEHGEKKPVKKGILLVAFGSSIPEAQVAYENIEKKVKAAFPDVPVHWAYTSHIIRHKLAKQGQNLDSVEIALAKMMEQGFTHVAVQSLHVIGGEEFHDTLTNVHAFGDMAGGFEQIFVGYPLLGTADDLTKVADAVIKTIPKKRKGNEAVILMGHGTPHPGNAFYQAMMYKFQVKDPNICVGTVEGEPTLGDITDMLVKKGVKKAYLMPFMAVAGDHARNDMAGDEPDSWKNILKKSGISCVPVLKGMAEYDLIADIWVDHLKNVMAHF
ncbi:sirohydrochlorin cobaltochelatase [Desulfonema magnum]|uniref:Anaerobic cobalt chelatase n=1 Tax=Desulfonema magnum TaxID=45655 RepID=A0A975BN45_9BACT|nr:sirohydrochlorin cobaltochelatase [Desulfonema magnum]QTA88759.1 Anaerobic cobalt chelatase [Desulfonema magnum]